MATIENRSERAFDIYAMPKGPDAPGQLYSVPRFTVGENDVRINGTAEMPDAVLAALLAGDPWTKALFDSGELAVISTAATPAPAATAAATDTTATDDKAAKGKAKT